jgi:hypothetical protein
MSERKKGKKGSKKDGVGGGLVCAHCKKVGELDSMKRCGRCRRACYCSVECQKLHWGEGGHKKVCRKDAQTAAASSSADASGGGVDVTPEHPCPICMETNAGAEFEMCFSCGETFCDTCKKAIAEHNVTNCPTCRAVLRVSAKEMVRLLLILVARPLSDRRTQCAQYRLGSCYANGHGVARNDVEAVRWYRLAAVQGTAGAQVALGICYEEGSGVAQNDAEAVRWYRMAADQGQPSGQVNLGTCYHTGAGIDEDPEEAVRLYRLSAAQENASAQNNLGLCYEDGIGVIEDRAEAARWYRLAADQGEADAQHNLGLCYADGIGVIEDRSEAARWYLLAANQGHPDAPAALAELGQ